MLSCSCTSLVWRRNRARAFPSLSNVAGTGSALRGPANATLAQERSTRQALFPGVTSPAIHPSTHLQNDVEIAGAEAQGSWSYYVIQVPQGSGMLLVEMDRMRGDPVLFVKHSDEGFCSWRSPRCAGL